MMVTRRDALAGSFCAIALGSHAHAAAGTRRLDLYRTGNKIGEKSVTVRRDGANVSVATDIAIDVKLLGVPVYRYRLTSREQWQDGRLISLEATTNDNGAAHFVRATRSSMGLAVDGSEFRGSVEGLIATTSYWSPAFLERPTWISTQDGRPFRVTARALGPVAFPANGGTLQATRWRIAGDLSLDLFYDASGEWVGVEFDARGETARFQLASRGGSLSPLWSGA